MSPSNSQSDAGVRAIIGLVALLGAFVLIWFNAGTRLICERALPMSAETPVRCEVGTWGFNRIALSTKVMQNVRSIERIEGRHGTDSRGSGGAAVFSFVFVTDHGRVSPGYFADLFASEPADHALLAEFFADKARPDVVIERSAGEHIGGHIAAIILLLLGLFTLLSALSGGRRR